MPTVHWKEMHTAEFCTKTFFLDSFKFQRTWTRHKLELLFRDLCTLGKYFDMTRLICNWMWQLVISAWNFEEIVTNIARTHFKDMDKRQMPCYETSGILHIIVNARISNKRSIKVLVSFSFTLTLFRKIFKIAFRFIKLLKYETQFI